MSERQRKLTITERLILTYIGYKTNRNFKFFMTNETLAKAICCKTSSTKVMVNKLVREGYLIKFCDDKGRRQLSLSGRTKNSLQRLKDEGKHLGRPYGFSYKKLQKKHNKIKELLDKNVSKSEIARLMGCTWSTLNRYINEAIIGNQLQNVISES